jgi:hypothetical protein
MNETDVNIANNECACDLQVAEMHGELLEFNDVLKKQLLVYEAQIKHLTDELVALRGPVRVACCLTCCFHAAVYSILLNSL